MLRVDSNVTGTRHVHRDCRTKRYTANLKHTRLCDGARREESSAPVEGDFKSVRQEIHAGVELKGTSFQGARSEIHCDCVVSGTCSEGFNGCFRARSRMTANGVSARFFNI